MLLTIPTTSSADVWALGCLLYTLCFHRHPFEDSAKLAIVNGNYKIPEGDTKYAMFHDLITQMLNVDPTCRPCTTQVSNHTLLILLKAMYTQANPFGLWKIGHFYRTN